MRNLYFKLTAILKKYVKTLCLAFINNMELTILNINVLLIKVSIIDGKKLI